MILDVDIGYFLSKVSHRVRIATLSCLMQGSFLMERKEHSSIFTAMHLQLAY